MEVAHLDKYSCFELAKAFQIELIRILLPLILFEIS